jgi:NTP pyrophosphohydrolases including oxidative damage repair enzymes
MAVSNHNRTKAYTQYAALPFRMNGGDAIEVMLITSRDTRRWIIPKGWPMKGLKPHETAACEAFEEAGLIGSIMKQAIGSFQYEKRLKEGKSVTCEVEIYPLEVKQQRAQWPEMHQRDGRWFSLSEAAALVEEMDLSRTLLKLNAATLRKQNAKKTGKLVQRFCEI